MICCCFCSRLSISNVSSVHFPAFFLLAQSFFQKNWESITTVAGVCRGGWGGGGSTVTDRRLFVLCLGCGLGVSVQRVGQQPPHRQGPKDGVAATQGTCHPHHPPTARQQEVGGGGEGESAGEGTSSRRNSQKRSVPKVEQNRHRFFDVGEWWLLS